MSLPTGSKRSHLEVAREAIAGGASIIQFREKEMSTRKMVEVGLALRALTHEKGVPLIVNDRLDVALAVEADGVHVGQDDMPAILARKLIGPEKILGVSAANLAEALEAEKAGADYLGVGPVFATATKPDAGPAIGLEMLREIIEHVSIPVVAIGGINHRNVADVIRAGADGVAVISAVVAAPDIAEAARRLRERIEEARSGLPGPSRRGGEECGFPS